MTGGDILIGIHLMKQPRKQDHFPGHRITCIFSASCLGTVACYERHECAQDDHQ